MSSKKNLLYSFFILSSLLLGLNLAWFNFFEIFNGFPWSNFYHILYALFFWLTLSFTLFFIATDDSLIWQYLFIGASLGFVIPFLILKPLVYSSLLLIFILFLIYAKNQFSSRMKLFVSFRFSEIFNPIAKSGFLFFFLIVGVLCFFQGQNRNNYLPIITPSILSPMVKPIAITINQQINSTFQKELIKLPALPFAKETLARAFLDQGFKQLTNNPGKKFLGMPSETFDLNQAEVATDGTVDLTPVLNLAVPVIANNLNTLLLPFASLLPILFFLIIVLSLFPIWSILQALIFVCCYFIFQLLLTCHFLTIKKNPVDQEQLLL